MGMSTNLRAFTPETDKDFIKHKKVLLACMEAEVSLPPETAKYFGSNEAYTGLLDEKLEVDLIEGLHYENYNTEVTEGFEVDLNKLPTGVTKIRFTNSW